MSSSFNVQSGEGYERLMGRWSRKLAVQFIDFARVDDGERVLDVGCGTGSLTFALAAAAQVKEVVAIDYSPIFVEEAKRRNSDDRIKVQQADACALPFPDGSFDRALSLLVLHFVPEAEKAVAEMRRVARPGGLVAAAVWDHLGGMPGMRMMWDTVAGFDERASQLRGQYCFQPMMRSGEMEAAFLKHGLVDVEQTSLLIRMEYESFKDYWEPISAGEGPLGKYVSSLDKSGKAELIKRFGPLTRPANLTDRARLRQSRGRAEASFQIASRTRFSRVSSDPRRGGRTGSREACACCYGPDCSSVRCRSGACALGPRTHPIGPKSTLCGRKRTIRFGAATRQSGCYLGHRVRRV